MYAPLLDSTGDSRPSVMEAKGRLYWIGGGALVLVSALLFLVNTNHGIGIYPDSLRYMQVSERPYDAPLYPWMLMLVSLLGIDLSLGAKAIALIFACANTFLIWHLLMRATGKLVYAAGGTALIILSPQFVTLHSLAMSEAPFLFFLLITVLAFLVYLETEERTWLKASAVALGVATLARFTAPPLGAAIAICLLLNPRHPVRRRIGDAALFAVVSAAIFLCWLVMSQIISDRSIGRAVWFYGNMGAKEWMMSLTALTAWLLPDDVPVAGRILVLAAFFAAATFLIVAHARRTLTHAREAKVVDALLPLLFGLFFIFYLGFMVLSTSAEANLSLNGRYAFPIYVTTVMMVTIALAQLSDAKGLLKMLHRGLVCLAVVVICSHAARTVVRSAEAYRSGVGYVSREWVNSPTMKFLRNLPAGATIYSNGADAAAYLLDRKVHFIPERFRLRTGLDDPANPFETQLQDLRTKLTQEDAYIAFFDTIYWRFYLVKEAELKERLSLVEIASEADGRVYVMPKATPENSNP